MRIIGIEFRVQYFHGRFGAQQQELSVIPTDIEFYFDSGIVISPLLVVCNVPFIDIILMLANPNFQLPPHCGALSGRDCVPISSADHRGLIVKPHR